MNIKLNSEFLFTKKLSDETIIALNVYINYANKTYDFMQANEEGVFPSRHNKEVETNKAYFELGLEVLEFIDSELYK